MALNRRTLNITCDLNGYLFCRMPDNTLEVEVKVKTKWGKYTLHQDSHTQTEKYYSWDRANRRSHIHTRRRKTPPREIVSSSWHTNTNSETDIPMGEGLGYPPQVSTNPELAATVSTSENELDNIEKDKIL